LKYVPRPGAHLTRAQAALVGEAMLDIRDGGSAITPDTLTDYARPKSSKIHSLYNWDVRQLAEDALRERSRYLIRSVVLLEVKSGKLFKPDYSLEIETTTTPEGERAYHKREVAISRDDAIEQLFKDFSIRLKTVAAEIRKTGLDKKFPNLRRIAVAIERNLKGRR
jgi:hypothetical protein